MTDRIALSRRALLASTGIAAIGALTPTALRAAPPTGEAPARGTNLFIGTGGDGHTYPGPALPFGMVQLGPDTDHARWAVCSGYHSGDGSIMGFSHTHLSGTGIGDMLDVLVVPTRGPVRLNPGPLDNPDAGYRQRFQDERAWPGFYGVTLESGVRSELTVTERTGWHRHRFPAGPGHILIDFAHMIADPSNDYPLIRNAMLDWDGDSLTGTRQVFRWAKGRWIHFALQLSRAPDRIRLFGDGDEPVGGTHVEGRRLKAVLEYDEAGGDPILIRCGLSGVDVAGAHANLRAEAVDWDFDARRRGAQARWDEALGRAQVSGGTADQRTMFRTALYHAQLAPTLFCDADGRYRALDDSVAAVPEGGAAFSTYSLWDTYRALHPLLTLIAPDRAKLLIDDIIRQTARSPYGPLVWPLQGRETGTMIGWHAVVPLAEGIAKGIPADYAAAWPVISRRSFDYDAPDQDNSLGRARYDRLGFVPADEVFESVSRTQEYAYDDHCSAMIAAAAGADRDARRLRARSANWRNVIDPEIGFARPRFADGSWWEPYDPFALGHMPKPGWRDYTEANGWQATVLNQHDIPGLIAHLGGEAAFEARLDSLFDAPSILPDNAPPDIAGLIGQYAHGNEPDQHAPYLYAYLGKPWKTQALVRRILLQFYRNAPDGLIGNEDCGQMSAWFLFSALGFYPVDPVSARYVLGAPLFDRAQLTVGGGRTVTVLARGNAPTHPYVRSVRWNGRPWTKSWIGHHQLSQGGTLSFEMSPIPNPRFGAAPADRPQFS